MTTDPEDLRLGEIFGSIAKPLPGDTFVADVMRRVRHRARVRERVLAVALLTGGALAAGPLLGLGSSADLMLPALDGWSVIATKLATIDYMSLSALVIATSVTALVFRWLSD